MVTPLLVLLALAQPTQASPTSPASPASPALGDVTQQGVALLLKMQEGEDHAEWPYEGVYREKGEIPTGYRVGGTAICAIALLDVPGYAEDDSRHEAVARAAKFVIASTKREDMSTKIAATYDVRGWGYTYGLELLLRLREMKAVAKDQNAASDRAITFFIDAIEETEIPKDGGWNYARSRGFSAPNPSSPFMTAPTLQALFHAKQCGFEVDAKVIDHALDALAAARTAQGSVVYSGTAATGGRAETPGACARMAATETTLFLAGRSTLSDVRSAIDAFIVHWEWLDKRRAQTGTHEGPYKIAPYYFYYGHYYAAQAVEQLPESERAEYRRRIADLVMKTRAQDGTWDDRVFPRTANFGTAMCLMALNMSDVPEPARLEARGQTKTK